MFAQEYLDNTDYFVLAEEKRMASMYAISQKPHGKPKNGGGKSTVMSALGMQFWMKTQMESS
jgi:hypothetical protein